MLTIKKIKKLASRPKVNSTAVENFLCSLDGMTYDEAVMNSELDAASYKWTTQTSAAIREGLIQHYFK